MPSRSRQTLSFLGGYFDLLLAIVGAVVVAILGLTGLFKSDLTEATLLVLAALSFGVVRERWLRDRLGDEVKHAIALTNSTAPWEVLKAKYSWEIMDSAGSMATAASRKLLRFLQTETLTIYEFSGVPGKVKKRIYEGRAPKSVSPRELQMIADNFPGPHGRKYAIISLGDVMRRGQTLEVSSRRELDDTFTDSREFVTVRVEVPTSELEMSVTWPGAREPHSLQIAATAGRLDHSIVLPQEAQRRSHQVHAHGFSPRAGRDHNAQLGMVRRPPRLGSRAIASLPTCSCRPAASRKHAILEPEDQMSLGEITGP